MNTLKVYTREVLCGGAFDVYWTTSNIRLRGHLEVNVDGNLRDKPIVAELSALHHLLEIKQVLGHDLVGTAGTRLIVSSGAIRKLKLRQSGKAHLVPFATFLSTRFAGCQIEVSKATNWF